MDPANSSVLQIMAQVRTARAQYQQTEEAQMALRNEALGILERRQAMPVFVDQVAVEPTAEGTVAVQGGVIGNQAQVGSTVTVRMTLVGQGGATVGSKDIAVTVPAPNEGVAFQDTIEVSGPVLGWKYEIVG